MAIADEDVAAVRAATDLVALVGEHVALRRQGRRMVGRCPFHAEKTPSFSVNREEGLYYCFGCQASGDAITFVRATEQLDFVGAVEHLAERAGIALRRDDSGRGAQRRRRAELLTAMEQAVAWYHERLVTHADAGPARQYLRSRGYGAEVVRQFRLGWAPDDWDSLCRALGVPYDVLSEAGLAFINRRERPQDALRARVLFPIFDSGGRAVAIGGRVLPPPEAGPPEADPAEARPAESGPSPSRGPAGLGPSLSRGPEPKYKNSPETPIYSKRRVLYGLHWAKAAVAETGEVVVCEGYTDVIAFFQAGLPRAVATCGTALAEDHFGLLRNFARRVVLAYDSDRAGQAAAERVYEWERRHELDIAVAALPPGTDPADLGQRDPEALRAAVEEAKPFLSFRVERVLGGADLSTAERRARAAEAALAVIAEHPNVLVRDQYVMEVAARCRLEADRLRPLLGRLRGGGAGRAGAGGAQAGGVGRPAGEGDRDRDPDRLGLECLRLAIHRPAEVADRLEEVLFRDPVQRAAFRALAGSATLHDAIAGAEPPAAGLLRRLAVEESEADPEVEVPRLVGAAARRALGGLEADVRAAPERAAELAPVTTWLGVEINALSEPELGLEAAARLLAWLVEWAEEE